MYSNVCGQLESTGDTVLFLGGCVNHESSAAIDGLRLDATSGTITGRVELWGRK